jgi:hypothetical protein
MPGIKTKVPYDFQIATKIKGSGELVPVASVTMDAFEYSEPQIKMMNLLRNNGYHVLLRNGQEVTQF